MGKRKSWKKLGKGQGKAWTVNTPGGVGKNYYLRAEEERITADDARSECDVWHLGNNGQLAKGAPEPGTKLTSAQQHQLLMQMRKRWG